MSWYKDLQFILSKNITGNWKHVASGASSLTLHLSYLLHFYSHGSIFSLSTLLSNNLCTVRLYPFKMHNAMRKLYALVKPPPQSRYRMLTWSSKVPHGPLLSVSLPLLWPPCSLRHKTIEIRSFNKPVMTFKCSRERKSHISHV